MALVDDVYATGQSGRRAVKELRSMGCVSTFFTIFSYSSDVEMQEVLGTEATALTYFKPMREKCLKKGIITPDQADKVTEQVDIYRKTIYE